MHALDDVSLTVQEGEFVGIGRALVVSPRIVSRCERVLHTIDGSVEEPAFSTPFPFKNRTNRVTWGKSCRW